MLDVDLLALNMLILHYFWKVKKRFEEPNTIKSVYMISFFLILVGWGKPCNESVRW